MSEDIKPVILGFAILLILSRGYICKYGRSVVLLRSYMRCQKC